MTGSAVSATVVLVVIAAIAVAGLSGLRALGITREHPWMQRIASRPWRDGQDVLKVAMRHLQDVFVVTPSGSLLAPTVVELQLNPGDLASLCEQMELGVISSSLTEVYEELVGVPPAGGPARQAASPPAFRSRRAVTGCGRAIRCRHRQNLVDVQDAHSAREFAYATPQHDYAGPVSSVWQDPGPTVAAGMTTILAASVAHHPRAPARDRLLGGGNPGVGRPGRARAG